VVSPLPPPASVAGVSIMGSQWIATTASPVQMTARVFTRLAGSEGPGEYVDDTSNVAWSADPVTVAQIDRNGRVTPISSGTARITMTYADRSTFLTIRVLPDYAGTWTGQFRITACSGAPDFRTCPRLMMNEGSPGPTMYSLRLVLTQDRDQVSGTLTQGTQASATTDTPVQGYVRQSGALVLEATVPQQGLEPMRITNWVSTVNAGATQLSGGYTTITPGRLSVGLDNYFTIRTEREFNGASRIQ
jgi:hypothetical protein